MKYIILLLIVTYLSLLYSTPSQSNFDSLSKPLSFSVRSDLESAASLVGSNLGGSNVVATFRARVPRYGYPTTLDLADSRYQYGVGIQAIYGFLLAIIVLFVGIIYCSCRICCNGCGVKDTDPDGYTKSEIWGAFVFGFVFIIATLLFAGLGLYYNQQFTDHVTGPNGTTVNAVDLLTVSSNYVTFINDLLLSITSSLNSCVNTVLDLLSGSSKITTGTAGLINIISNTGYYISNYNVSTTHGNFSCSYCATVGTQITNMGNQISSQTTDPLNSMQSTVTSVENNIVSISSDINTRISSVSTSLINANSSMQSSITTIQPYVDRSSQYDSYRTWVVLAIFFLPCSFFLFYIIGAIAKAPGIFHSVWIIAFFVCFLSFILFGVHLPVAVLISDGCTYIDDKAANLDSTFNGNLDTVRIVNASLFNTSLIDVYSLNSQLNFTTIVFPSIPTLNESFTFSTINSFTSDVNALNLTTFGFDSSTVDTALNNLNALTTPDHFTRSNISSCVPASYPDPTAVDYAKGNASMLITTETELTVSLNILKANATGVQTYATQLNSDIQGVYNNISTIQNVTSSLFHFGTDLRNNAYIGFVGVRYYSLNDNVCINILTDTAMLAFCFFLVGSFNLFVLCCSVSLSKRIAMPRNADSYDDDGDRIHPVNFGYGHNDRTFGGGRLTTSMGSRGTLPNTLNDDDY